MTLLQNIDLPIIKLLKQISSCVSTDDVYVVGGFVRDALLNIPNKDIDFVVVGNGIEFAKTVKETLHGDYIVTYNQFGTAKVGIGDLELEFVGARSEKYSPNTRKPVVEDADLASDLSRRDFTINAMAMSIHPDSFGECIDLFNGQEDLKNGVIRTPLDPFTTFTDDPLRIMRAIRFATRFKYIIEDTTYRAIKKTTSRLSIISYERITEELKKTCATQHPSEGLHTLHESGILAIILPEISRKTVLEAEVFFKNETVISWPFHWKLAYLFLEEGLNKIQIKAVLKRLKSSNEMIAQIIYLSEFKLHTTTFLSEKLNPIKAKLFLYHAGKNYLELIQFFGISAKNLHEVTRFLEHIDTNTQFSLFELALNGEDIQKILCIEKGRRIGELKEKLTLAVLNEQVENTITELTHFLTQGLSDDRTC